MLPTNTDEQILAWIQTPATSERGFHLLVNTYQQALYRHIRHIVGGHDDADDVLQNTLIKVFRNIQTFERKSKLFTWLYRIATNEALTFVDSRKRKATETIDNPDQQALMAQMKADVWYDGEEIQQKLQVALTTLPEKQKLVFNMRYFDEMPYEQMSEILETSVGSLKASYHHAAKKIEAFIMNYEL